MCGARATIPRDLQDHTRQPPPTKASHIPAAIFKAILFSETVIVSPGSGSGSTSIPQNRAQPNPLNSAVERVSKRRVVGHDVTFAFCGIQHEVCSPTGVGAGVRNQLVITQISRGSRCIFVTEYPKPMPSGKV